MDATIGEQSTAELTHSENLLRGKTIYDEFPGYCEARWNDFVGDFYNKFKTMTENQIKLSIDSFKKNLGLSESEKYRFIANDLFLSNEIYTRIYNELIYDGIDAPSNKDAKLFADWQDKVDNFVTRMATRGLDMDSVMSENKGFNLRKMAINDLTLGEAQTPLLKDAFSIVSKGEQSQGAINEFLRLHARELPTLSNSYDPLGPGDRKNLFLVERELKLPPRSLETYLEMRGIEKSKLKNKSDSQLRNFFSTKILAIKEMLRKDNKSETVAA